MAGYQFLEQQPGYSEACRKEKSCFMALDSGLNQQLCWAYIEQKSCFISIDNPTDVGWCEHLRDGKSCFIALDGQARQACELGLIPQSHHFWLN